MQCNMQYNMEYIIQYTIQYITQCIMQTKNTIITISLARHVTGTTKILGVVCTLLRYD